MGLAASLGLLLSILSSTVARFETAVINLGGPTGIVGGWPVGFMEYRIAFGRYDTFRLPSGVFFLPAQGIAYEPGPFFGAFFLGNVLLWSIVSWLVLRLVARAFPAKAPADPRRAHSRVPNGSVEI